jgi:hypothetical protein
MMSLNADIMPGIQLDDDSWLRRLRVVAAQDAGQHERPPEPRVRALRDIQVAGNRV